MLERSIKMKRPAAAQNVANQLIAPVLDRLDPHPQEATGYLVSATKA